MKGNFSRFTFDRRKHFSGVVLQQGRVQLDADWNEQLDIATHLRRQAVADLLGPSGAPVDGGGFAISVAGGEIRVSPGRFWLDGLLIENESEATINGQPHLPQPGIPSAPAPDPGNPETDFPAGLYAAYLDVWERHITALEDIELLEPALGGPDTATRRQTVWQLKVQKLDSEDLGCPDLAGFDPIGGGAAPTLAVRTVGAVEDNRLYRVEVHRGSGDPEGPTFKWSRDNAAVAARIDKPAQFQIFLTGQVDQDLSNGFAAGQWIEVTDEERLLKGKPGVFARLASVSGQILTVEGWPEANDPVPDLPNQPIVRRWDSQRDVAIPTDGVFNALDDGLEIRFGAPAAHYRNGDYWLVPVRTGAGALWPLDEGTDAPRLQPPDGIEHRFEPVALLRLDEPTSGAATGWSLVESCRTVFQPASALQGDKVDVAGDTMTGPLLIDEASLTVRAGGRNAFRVTDTGRVGVGTDDPQATLQVAGGPIMPAEGASEDAAGILFPRDAFGGVGNRAWIRYASRGGEATALEIGNRGDVSPEAKHIALMPSGNVGIGIPVPRARLEVVGGIRVSGDAQGTLLYNDRNASGAPGSDGFRMRYDGAFFSGTGDALVIEKTDGNNTNPDGGIAFVNTGRDGVVETALSIRGNGRVGIGTKVPQAAFQVATGEIMPAAGTGGGIAFPRDPGGGGGDRARMRYYSRGGERMLLELRTDNDGPGGAADDIALMPSSRVGIKTTEPFFDLHVAGVAFSIHGVLTSDARWKKEVETLTGCLDKVERLRGVGFSWRQDDYPDMGFTPGRHLGLVAQEVEEVIPELVMTADNGFKSLEYGNLTAVLVEAIKELSARYRALEARIPEAGSEGTEVVA